MNESQFQDSHLWNSEEQFQEKIKKLMYKTTSQNFGSLKPKIVNDTQHGINGKFTDLLLYSGMYKNGSLNTTPDKDRWLNGSKDWMDKLG